MAREFWQRKAGPHSGRDDPAGVPRLARPGGATPAAANPIRVSAGRMEPTLTTTRGKGGSPLEVGCPHSPSRGGADLGSCPAVDSNFSCSFFAVAICLGVTPQQNSGKGGQTSHRSLGGLSRSPDPFHFFPSLSLFCLGAAEREATAAHSPAADRFVWKRAAGKSDQVQTTSTHPHGLYLLPERSNIVAERPREAR